MYLYTLLRREKGFFKNLTSTTNNFISFACFVSVVKNASASPWKSVIAKNTTQKIATLIWRNRNTRLHFSSWIKETRRSTKHKERIIIRVFFIPERSQTRHPPPETFTIPINASLSHTQNRRSFFMMFIWNKTFPTAVKLYGKNLLDCGLIFLLFAFRNLDYDSMAVFYIIEPWRCPRPSLSFRSTGFNPGEGSHWPSELFRLLCGTPSTKVYFPIRTTDVRFLAIYLRAHAQS